MIDLYTQKEPHSGRGPNQPSDAFAPNENVTLYANVTYNGFPVLGRIVTFEVNGPINNVENISQTRTAITGAGGAANFTFTIPQPSEKAKEAVFGTWSALAYVDIALVQAKDTLSFQVDWILEILSIESVDAANASKTSFKREEQVYFRMRIKNIAKTEKVAALVISLYDNFKTPIGSIIMENQNISSGIASYLSEGLTIPERAFIGTATAYVTAFTALPAKGGIPWSLETSTTFEILPKPVLPSKPLELWLLILIVLIALLSAFFAFFIYRIRRKGKKPSPESTTIGERYKRYQKSTRKTASIKISCPRCGLYHSPWPKPSSD